LPATKDEPMLIKRGLASGYFLQRRSGGARTTIHGACRDDGPVVVSVRSKGRALRGLGSRRIGQARGGKFVARLTGVPAGGPYTVILSCGRETIELREVFVGDLWLMAGQSNMEGCANMEDAPKPHPLVRCFTLARRWELAREPLHLKPESPDPAHNGMALSPAAAARMRRQIRKGTGLGVHFGRLMHARTGVPQGLIATAHGGSSMQQWDPALRGRGGQSLYGSMLLSLRAVDQPLAGILWYQGESEALPGLAPVYTKRMRRLVAAVRRDLAQPNLPWLMVQIGRFIRNPRSSDPWPEPAAWNDIQEQQRVLPRVVPRCMVVPAVDLELDDCAHIGGDGFVILAKRLAEIASLIVHHDAKAHAAIQLRSVRHRTARAPYGPRIEVAFAHVVGGLGGTGPIHGFTLLDGHGQPAPLIHRVRLQGNRALLHLTGTDIAGLQLRYGHGLDPACSLIDARGMAVPAFGPVPIR
jgi:hypothetical protein